MVYGDIGMMENNSGRNKAFFEYYFDAKNTKLGESVTVGPALHIDIPSLMPSINGNYYSVIKTNEKMQEMFDRIYKKIEEQKEQEALKTLINKIIINGPATVFIWKDGSKTVVKCMEGDKYDLYTAFCIALTKKLVGSNSKIKTILKKANVVDQNPKMATEENEKEIAEIIDRIKKGLNRQINSMKI